MPAWNLVFLVTLLAVFSACAGKRCELEAGAVRNLRKAELLNFPQSYRMVHRVRLNVRGRSMDFIGYLAVNGTCLRAITVMEIGGEMFDLLSCDGIMSVLKNPARVPLKPLKRGILRELAFIFAPAASGQSASGAGDYNVAKITARVKGAALSAGDEKKIAGPVELLLFQNNCLFSEIEIHSFRIMEGWPHPVPDRFTLRNRHWGYVMEVELLRMDMRPVEKKVFSGQ